MPTLRSLLLSLVVFSMASIHVAGKEYLVFYLGGQSNMEGFGYVRELPAELGGPIGGIYIFHGSTAPDGPPVDGRGLWAVLQPGHGTGFRSDGRHNTYSERFGVELTLGVRLAELLPGRNIALIKYDRGGSSIDCRAAANFGCWDPDFEGPTGVNQYDHFLATLRSALAVQDIDGDGEDDTLIPAGIVWMQGESDAAHGSEIAFLYERNLRRLVDLFRAALRADDLPVVVGRISDSGRQEDGRVWDDGEIVRAGQAEFVRKDAAARLITSTDTYGYSDPWHYDSAGYLDLGRQFAEALVDLINATPGDSR